ncbi:hypothetical protein Hanom_Chr03g00198971 [Helianthus anomalus]
MKASMASTKKEVDGFSKKEEAWVKKVGELTRRHEIEADREALNVQQKAFKEEKEGLKTLDAQDTGDNQWLIEQGFHQVVTYLLHSKEFNSALGDSTPNCYKLHESGLPLEESPLYRP